MLVVSLAILAAVFQFGPLEWNVNYPTDVPYEFAINPSKFGAADARAFQVYADGKALETIVLEDKFAQFPILRFLVPSGTQKLSLGRGAALSANSGEYANFFSGQKWKADGNARVSVTKDGVLAEALNIGTGLASCRFDVPVNCAGKSVAIELDCKSLTKLMWNAKIWFAQYDASGRLLPETVSDHRWTTHYRPYEAFTPFRERGRIHPEAKYLELNVEMDFERHRFDDYGKPLEDDELARPRLLVSHVAVRPAASLPFPAYRDNYFANGVSDAAGDMSLSLDSDRTFWFCTRSSASWAGDVQIRREEECFYPTQAGTVEAWFKADWQLCPKKTYLFQAVNNMNTVLRSDLGSVMEVVYAPSSHQLTYKLKDVNGRSFSGSANVTIPEREWFHLAATWHPGGEACLFLDGRQICEFSVSGYVCSDLAKSEFPNNDHAMEFYLGSDYRVSRVMEETKRRQKKESFFVGDADALRISTGVRYLADFKPERRFSLDSDTRALFDFDRSFDGLSGGGAAWISGTLRASRDRQMNKIGDIQYYPDELPDSMNPSVVLSKWNTDVADTLDFAASEKTTRLNFSLKAGEKTVVVAPKGVFTDYLEIANEGSDVLRAPIVLRNGDIDVRSYGNIAQTLFLAGDSEFQKANRIFNLLLTSSDYFMNHIATFDAGSDKPRNVEYDSMELLNSYCGFECGPLNNLAALLFTSVAGLPAGWTGGYGHSFEQVFFDGRNNCYDLSAQRFFPMMNNERPASLGDMEEQPSVNYRWGASANHFIRNGSRPVRNWKVRYPESFAFNLNPGEKMRFYWVNNGQVNDLQCSNLFARKAPDDKKGFEPFYEQTHAVQYKNGLYRAIRLFPEYGNAFLSFDGKPMEDNPAFVRIESDSFCYNVKVPYPIVAASYKAVTHVGLPVDIEISTDGGKTFRAFNSPADYQVRARKAYLIKVCAPIASVRRFTASTEMMTNSRMLMGSLQEGANELMLKAESEGKARVTYQYHEPAPAIEFVGARSFGPYKGCTKHLVLFDPSLGPKTVKVRGISKAARLIVTGDVKASLVKGVLKLETENFDSRFAHVTVKDGDYSKTLTILVCKGSRMIDIDRDVIRKEKVQLDFKALPAGNYALLTLCRCTVDNLNPREPAVSVSFEGQSKQRTAVSCINTSADFYKKIFGKEGEKGAWRWDFPIDKETKYPYGLIEYIPLKEGTRTMEYESRKFESTDLACAMLIPQAGDDFTRELYKTLFSINNRPWVIE